MSSLPCVSTTFSKALLWALTGIACFHLAYETDWLRGLIVVFLFSLVPLAHLGTPRRAFYLGFVVGFGIYAPQLAFFWTIFNVAAIALWSVLAFWLALFLLLSQQAFVRYGRMGLILIPVLWVGIEFFRSELYYLRFSWLTPGLVYSGTELASALGILGVYGIGFLLFAAAIIAWALPLKLRAISIALVVVGGCFLGRPVLPSAVDGGSVVRVAGVQMEFPDEDQVLNALNEMRSSQTNAVLFVLSEYTFNGPLPAKIMEWCRDNKKHLVVGGHDPAGENYFNTAFVIGPTGDVVARQAKSVPIQFFNDGLPARQQKAWESPWGRLGLAVCYDLSYRRVMDRLVTQQCQGFVIPTMDVVEWGKRQHGLHARIAPMRAAEMDIPIFRLCSSGISQAVEAGGAVTATAPFPGENAVIAASMALKRPARIPWDHWLGPPAVVSVAMFLVVCVVSALRAKKPSSPAKNPTDQS